MLHEQRGSTMHSTFRRHGHNIVTSQCLVSAMKRIRICALLRFYIIGNDVRTVDCLAQFSYFRLLRCLPVLCRKLACDAFNVGFEQPDFKFPKIICSHLKTVMIANRIMTSVPVIRNSLQR